MGIATLRMMLGVTNLPFFRSATFDLFPTCPGKLLVVYGSKVRATTVAVISFQSEE